MLNDKDEVALALFLWRSLRGKFTGAVSKNALTATEDNLEITGEALRLAEAVGVKQELLALILKHPVTQITMKELEPWESPRQSERSAKATGKKLSCSAVNLKGRKARKPD